MFIWRFLITRHMQGADVNRMHGTLKPLHCACMVADADCVELLLEKGAEV